MSNLLKTKDIFLLKGGTATPTNANAYLTDGNVTLEISPATYETDLIGKGIGNSKETRAVKNSVPISLSGNIVFMEPTTLNEGMPQIDLLEACGWVQEIVPDTSITLYPSLNTVSAMLAYYKGGEMKYPIKKAIGSIDITASAANTKVSGAMKLQGTYEPAEVVNEVLSNPIVVENDFFRLSKDSFVNVNGSARCPFGDISIVMKPEINGGDDSRVCTEISLDQVTPMLSFSEVLNSDSDSNLLPISNWLNDTDITISFPLFSKNYKMEIKINKGIEEIPDNDESGLKWLQKRNIRLRNDSNGRAFEIVITPLA